ncbi:acetylornithine transaminase [Enterococcus alishanensis]|uniref:Acetylornithine aminotransferase n=1 Tax=Enterococcus alishanensis TaxID=1303817 RepID=A0ABS6TBC3_9ENTE|nr:acetylornithine transaminase [Enterococcus alishanensis]MBV7390203.1 acetylornithine transaminase [Enterococcus alishanensis]
MTHLFPNYGRDTIDLVKGEASYVYDQTGKQYLDLTSGIGVTSLGHQHPKVTAAVTEQINQIWHTSNLYFSQLQEEVAEKLAQDKDYVSFFCNSGAEANEAALKLARKATGRSKIISFNQGFHGRTYGSMSATAQEKIQAGFGPMVPDFIYLPYNDLENFEAALDDDVAAVILELIQGEGGVLPADEKFVKGLVEKAHANGTLVIIDEVQTGIGRTGTFYCHQGYGIEPDIFTLAKALGNGLPIGAMLGKAEFATTFGPGSHGTTFGGNKLALSAANIVIDTISEPDFLAEINKKSQQFFEQLNDLTELSMIKKIRGQGLMIGIQFDNDKPLNFVLNELKEQGVLALKAGNHVLRLLPPLTISTAEITQAATAIKTACKKIIEK